MKSLLRIARTLGITCLAVLTVQLGALVASPAADAKSQTAIVVSAVNVRTGPSTKYKRIAVIYPGETITQTGKAGAWYIVKYKGKKAYVHGDYLTIKGGTTKVSSGGATGVRYSSYSLNVRTAPRLSSKVYKTVKAGTAFRLTGKTSNGFSEVEYAGKNYWVWANYTQKTAPKVSSSSLPKITGKMKLTGRLMIRTDSTSNFISIGKLPIGSIINVTGVKRNGVVQAVYKNQVVWFDANWVVKVSTSTSKPTSSGTPSSIGTRVSTAVLNVRAKATTSSAKLATEPAGTKFKVTGKVSNGYAQVVWNGRTGWVAAQWLKAVGSASLVTSWSAGLDSLQSAGKKIVTTVHTKFPRVSVMYGVRFDSLPDHPSGKAVDVMLPGNYKNEQSYGWAIANYMRANAKRLNIRYMIFAQHVWNPQVNNQWRKFSSRGSDNANHYNHVHITTY